MLDERKASILRAVVTEYIETAQPVGSVHVTRSPHVEVSSATVRNEMAMLETEGYLTQPHTSAGRIPTDKGYRFFVDNLAGRGELAPVQRQQVREFFASTHGELERMLGDTSKLLSRLTDYAAVVVGPAHEAATIRSVQLVGLGPRLALLVMVFSEGAIEKRTVELSQDTGEERIASASASLSHRLIGKSLKQVAKEQASTDFPGSQPRRARRAGGDLVVAAAIATLSRAEEEAEHVFVGGASRMAAAFEAVETVRSVLAILEQQFLVVTLLRDVLDRGMSVAIGTEHGVVPLAECAVVVAPFGEGADSGTVGVLGPTRMDYSKALAAVGVVSSRLGHHLSEG